MSSVTFENKNIKCYKRNRASGSVCNQKGKNRRKPKKKPMIKQNFQAPKAKGKKNKNTYHKKYYEKNKAKLKAYNASYYQKNKARLKKKRDEKK